MGLIRGMLHIQTAGVVSDKSKKQRVAQATLDAIRGQSLMAIATLPNMTAAEKYRLMLTQPDLSWPDRQHIKGKLNDEIKAGRG